MIFGLPMHRPDALSKPGNSGLLVVSVCPTSSTADCSSALGITGPYGRLSEKVWVIGNTLRTRHPRCRSTARPAGCRKALPGNTRALGEVRRFDGRGVRSGMQRRQAGGGVVQGRLGVGSVESCRLCCCASRIESRARAAVWGRTTGTGPCPEAGPGPWVWTLSDSVCWSGLRGTWRRCAGSEGDSAANRGIPYFWQFPVRFGTESKLALLGRSEGRIRAVGEYGEGSLRPKLGGSVITVLLDLRAGNRFRNRLGGTVP